MWLFGSICPGDYKVVPDVLVHSLCPAHISLCISPIPLTHRVVALILTLCPGCCSHFLPWFWTLWCAVLTASGPSVGGVQCWGQSGEQYQAVVGDNSARLSLSRREPFRRLVSAANQGEVLFLGGVPYGYLGIPTLGGSPQRSRLLGSNL